VTLTNKVLEAFPVSGDWQGEGQDPQNSAGRLWPWIGGQLNIAVKMDEVLTAAKSVTELLGVATAGVIWRMEQCPNS
jgi:hypothetical protein